MKNMQKTNLFSGLEELGFHNVDKLELYPKKESNREDRGNGVEKKSMVESDYLFDKTYTCPVCDGTFKSKAIKAGKVKLLTSDTDLKPKYQYVDCIKYDAIVCPQCGYATLARFFGQVTSSQIKNVKENISAKYKHHTFGESMYSYDEAITRHKLALLNAMVMNAKDSVKAYTCLKIAWLYRSKSESLSKEEQIDSKKVEELSQRETEFIRSAYEGFSNALQKEHFPMCGMDENTVMYLIAELARRCKQYDDALRMLSHVLVSRNASERIKSKARDVKELIRTEMKE